MASFFLLSCDSDSLGCRDLVAHKGEWPAGGVWFEIGVAKGDWTMLDDCALAAILLKKQKTKAMNIANEIKIT